MWCDILCSAFLLCISLKLAWTQNASGCQTEPACLKCSSAGCVKCPALIMYPSRKCVNSCPFGYIVKWSNQIDIMGQVCERSTRYLGLSANGASILFGSLCGLALCLVVVIVGILYTRYKRKQLPQVVETNSDVDDSPEKRDFLKQLEILRPYASTFLDMLNEARKQTRELHQEGDFNSLSVYKPVIRDLAKILLLLNRPVEHLSVPTDWEHLYNWAEKALKRYKRMSETSQTQVNQLIKFLQSPVDLSVPEEYPRISTSMSTFKPDHFGSSFSLQESKTKNSTGSGLNVTLNPQWQFNYPLVSKKQFNSSEFIPTHWKNSREYLSSSYYLEDDFLHLGCRPQDEITTEL